MRAHYPGCTECSAEVAKWSELEGLVREASTSTHPSEEALLTYRTSPASLSREDGAALARHLEACAVCRDALGAVSSSIFSRSWTFLW